MIKTVHLIKPDGKRLCGPHVRGHAEGFPMEDYKGLNDPRIPRHRKCAGCHSAWATLRRAGMIQ